MRCSERERKEPNMRHRLSNTVLSARKKMSMDWEVPGQPWHQLRRNIKGKDEKK